MANGLITQHKNVRNPPKSPYLLQNRSLVWIILLRDTISAEPVEYEMRQHIHKNFTIDYIFKLDQKPKNLLDQSVSTSFQ